MENSMNISTFNIPGTLSREYSPEFHRELFPNIPRKYHGNVPPIFHEHISARWDVIFFCTLTRKERFLPKCIILTFLEL